MNRSLIALVAAMVALPASAEFVDFNGNLLVSASPIGNGWTAANAGRNVNFTTANGLISPLAAGIYTGLWFSQATIADGTYAIDFGGDTVHTMSFSVNAISGNGTPPGEAFSDFTVLGGTADSYGLTVAGPLSVYGNTLSTLNIVADQLQDNGSYTLTLTSAAGFTGVSFRHTQNPNQNGSVLIDVNADFVPAPATAALALAGLVATRRRR